MVRVGICGSGFMGRMHAICYSKMKDVEVTAIASKDKVSGTALAHDCKARLYEDAGDLIREAEVDIVDICLPTYLHAEYAIQAARRGRAVFCEKPLALTLSDADRVVRAVRKAGVPAMVGHCIRFWPEYVALKKFHDEGALGRLLALSLSRYQGKITFGWKDWFNKPELSGCSFLDFHIHDVDFMRHLLGEPDGVDSIGHCRWSVTNYHYPGIVVTSEAGWSCADPFEMCFRAVFEKGVLLYSSRRQPLTLYRPNRAPKTVPLQVEKSGDASAGGNISDIRAYFNELKYFTDAVKNGRAAEAITLEDARDSLALVLKEMRGAARQWKKAPRRG
jgi:predicted dehydrogenase